MNWYETYSVLWKYKQQVKGKIRPVVQIDLSCLPWLLFLVLIMRSYHWGTVSVPFIFFYQVPCLAFYEYNVMLNPVPFSLNRIEANLGRHLLKALNLNIKPELSHSNNSHWQHLFSK